MGLVNVRRDVKDSFYRYKMEELQTKVEGKGNGIKTVIVNLPSVAASLARPSSHVIKYFGFELGAPTKFYPQGERWIINGAHQAKTLQDLLDGFIDKFVLCKMCKNPETDVVLREGGRIVLDCKACGQRSEVDLRLKLSGFILKEAPKKGKKDKAERRAAKKAKQNGTENGQGSGDDDSENGSNEANGSGEAGSDDEFEKVQAEAINAAAVQDIEVKDDEWAVDMSAEAVKARQAQLPDEFKQKLNIGDDDEDGEGGGNTVYDALGDWIDEQAQEKGGIDKVQSIDVYVKAKELGIEGKHRTVLVLVQTLFNENICAQIPKRASMLKQVVTSERHEKALLGGTERLIGALSKDHPDLLKQVVKILQLYYHHDLITEEVVVPWGSKASKKYTDLATSRKVRKAAEPFLVWLKEADEEESSEESE
ncbi:Eukaryotic translation initiation factor 5 [Cladobotryum mycophilum]|uniref:Eukaryotic translation initiation factor 5 n=1 Tax=Cladobotryum mycophilum TaxID=491253 RepID=A0ABR0S9L9_9HYPO